MTKGGVAADTGGKREAKAATAQSGRAPVATAPVPIRPVPPVTTPFAVHPPVCRAHMRQRHWLALLSLVLLVVAPVGASVWYLQARAADQYASEAAFSVRRDEGGASAAGLLGGLAQFTGSSPSPDAEILWQLLHSQDFVAGIDAALDLRAMWSRPGTSWTTGDPVFAFEPSGMIEDLADYWARMVRVSSDPGSGLIILRVLAFRPEDATAIAREILARSETAINALNDAARTDALRHADDDLALAVDRLKDARAALTQFRNLHQIVDPDADLQAQSGLIGSLEEQLAQAMIEADLLAESATPADPRLVQGRRRIAVIEARIAEERRHLGAGVAGGGEGHLAALVGDYERLQVDAEFARESWLAAMAAADAARAGAARQSRYLVAHIPPGMAESARYPARMMIAGLVALFSMLAWAILVLVAWSLRDRR